jgi:hypothetical protein
VQAKDADIKILECGRVGGVNGEMLNLRHRGLS